MNQGRRNPPARDYLARKQHAGKSRREAVRALERHLASVVYRAMQTMATAPPAEVAAAPALALERSPAPCFSALPARATSL